MGGKTSKRKSDSQQYIRRLHRQVPNMNLDEVHGIYKDFNRFSGRRRKLNKSSFRKVYKQAFGESANELSDAIFHSFDTDGDGRIDFEEFLVGLSVADPTANDTQTRKQKLRWAFNVYDKDRSGTITKAEMVSMVKAVFHISDIPEVLPKETAESLAEKLFHSVDDDGDGEITFEEFEKAAEEDETIINLLLPSPKQN